MNHMMDISYKKENWEKLSLLGVKIDALALDQLFSEIQSYVLHKHGAIISYVNVHAMNLAFSTPWFRTFLNQSDLTFCDGVGIKIAARLTRQHLRYRFTPPDFMDQICANAANLSWKIFFLGAKPGVARRAADILTHRFPGLQIQTHHGYFNKSAHSWENQSVIEQINQFHPHILVVGFGMPIQERWILENIRSLHVKVAFTAGALFDYLSGNLPRAPRWMTDYGFEWLVRLLIEPGRLGKRYVIGNPLFFWRLFYHHFLGVPLPH